VHVVGGQVGDRSTAVVVVVDPGVFPLNESNWF
jgi:hypothetical protein